MENKKRSEPSDATALSKQYDWRELQKQAFEHGDGQVPGFFDFLVEMSPLEYAEDQCGENGKSSR